MLCPAGWFGTSTVSCEVCPAGYVTDRLAGKGATNCKMCDSGFFDGDTTSTTACEACPGGWFGAPGLMNQTNVTLACPHPCPGGKFGNQHIKGQWDVDEACPSKCSVGRYGDVRGGAFPPTPPPGVP